MTQADRGAGPALHTDPNCVFCKIIAGELPSRMVYTDDTVVVFKDIRPRMPVHLLVVPREHIPDLEAIEPRHEGILARLLLVAAKVAADEGLARRGYRLVLNDGADSGQEVFHIHLHVLGGRRMGPMA